MNEDLNFMIVGFNDIEVVEDENKGIKKHETFTIRACINGKFKSVTLPKDFKPRDLKDVLMIFFTDL